MDYNVFLLNIQDKINQEDFFNLKLKFEQLCKGYFKKNM